MSDDEERSTKPRLLTEEEAAKILRRSTGAVKRLRLSGALAYIPGRPPMIDEADLEEYITRAKVRGTPGSSWQAATPEAREEIVENARAWVLKQKMKPPRKRRSG
ncbi:MAG: helix-turn-helix domain-containing protein [Devosia sp.]|nr:helix-turn-helix domain-containing protein [Devosia sp.]